MNKLEYTCNKKDQTMSEKRSRIESKSYNLTRTYASKRQKTLQDNVNRKKRIAPQGNT